MIQLAAPGQERDHPRNAVREPEIPVAVGEVVPQHWVGVGWGPEAGALGPASGALDQLRDDHTQAPRRRRIRHALEEVHAEPDQSADDVDLDPGPAQEQLQPLVELGIEPEIAYPVQLAEMIAGPSRPGETVEQRRIPRDGGKTIGGPIEQPGRRVLVMAVASRHRASEIAEEQRDSRKPVGQVDRVRRIVAGERDRDVIDRRFDLICQRIIDQDRAPHPDDCRRSYPRSQPRQCRVRMAGGIVRPAVAFDKLVGRTLGEFVLRERIGEGGFGAVYRASQPVLDREAVVKVLHPRLRSAALMTERFLREAKLASKLDHPYAAHIYAFGAEADGSLWIAMELVRGTPLSEVLRLQGPLPLERFVPLLERICEVVQTAHDQGVVHRDLKPANVMVLARAGRLLPKLLDFGIAKALTASPTPVGSEDTHPAQDEVGEARALAPHGDAALTQRGAVMGSPPYMAPEQWRDAAMVDARTDLYALGVLAYESLTGRQPFHADTITGFASAHATHPIPGVGSKLPVALDEVFARVLAKRPDDRFSDALSFAAAFRQASGVGVESPGLPMIDEALREATIASAPQPIAEAVAAIEAARNPHQARDAMWQLVRAAVQYLGLIALACRTRISDRGDPPGVADMLRALSRRILSDREWMELTRELTRPWVDRRDAYPVPELVDMFHPTSDGVAADTGLDELLALHDAATGTADAALLALLERTVAAATRFLREIGFLQHYLLVVPVSADVAERWMGVRRAQRMTTTLRARSVVAGVPALLDESGAPVLSLGPVFQVAAPTPGAPLELFLFEGRGRHGAKLVALPHGFERHDDAVWDWFRSQLSASFDETEAAAFEERPPYRGLQAFSTEDSASFFGREKLVDAFINRLRVQPSISVVGRSGAGKSSFVHAGVIPALPAGWRAVVMRPGSAPIATLVARLEAVGVGAVGLEAALRRDRNVLGEWLRARATSSGPILLVVDQLEELFTLCSDAEDRRAFAEAVVAAARSPDDPVRVVFTLRDDFLIRAEQVPALRNRIGQSLQLLTVPAADDLIRILVEPARRVGYEFDDPDLPAEMVKAIVDQPGALALLSFTASRLWELRDRHFKQLTRTAYRSLGGVGGALAQHAERTVEEMTADERGLTREAFRHLVTAQSTRAVLLRADLKQLLGAHAQAEIVIEKLVAARLLVAAEDETGRDTIEIVHEALLAAWPRLVEWRREDAEGARFREQLRAAAAQWEDRGRAKGLLWRGDALADLIRWRARHTGPLTTIEAAFADASMRDAARGRRIRRGLLAATIAVLGAGLFVLFVVNSRTQRERERAAIAQSRAEETLAQLYLEQGRQRFVAGDPMRALVLLDAAARAGARGAGLEYMTARTTAMLAKQRLALVGHLGLVRDGMFSRDGRLVISIGEDGTARTWDAATGAPRATLRGHDGTLNAMDLGADSLLVTAGKDGTARVWNLATGAVVHVLAGHDGWVWDAKFSPDGRRVVTADDRGARIWDVASGRQLVVLEGHDQGVFRVRFSPDGSRIYTASPDRTAAEWDAIDGRRLAVLRGHTEPLSTVAISPDGTTVATGSADGTVRLWRGTVTTSVLDAQSPVRKVFFDATGATIAALTPDSVQLWRVASGERIHLLRSGEELSAAAFAPSGMQIASASEEGTVRLWDVRTGQVEAMIPSAGAVRWVAYDPLGTRIALGGSGASAVWDASRDVLVRTLEGIGQAVRAVALAPDGSALVGCGNAGALVVWDTRTGTVVARRQHGRGECQVAYAPDGSRFVTGGDDGVLRVWDAHRAEERSQIPTGKHDTNAIAFSPDGTRLLHAAGSRVTAFTLSTLAPVWSLDGHLGGIHWAAWSADGARIATCGPRDARVWTIATGASVQLPQDGCRSIGFSSDGRHVVTASRKVALVWTVEGALLGVLEGHRADVRSALYLPNGLVVTTSFDRTARIWDPRTARTVDSLYHPDWVWHADLDRAGSRLATAGEDQRVYLWDLVVPRRDPRPFLSDLPFTLQSGLLMPRQEGR